MTSSTDKDNSAKPEAADTPPDDKGGKDNPPQQEPEYGGRKGPEPTRYGDWEVDGRCTDF